MKMKNHDKFSKDKFLQKPGFFHKVSSNVEVLAVPTNFGLFFWSYTNDQYLAVNKAKEFELL